MRHWPQVLFGVALCALSSVPVSAADNPSFEIRLGQDGETLGDLHPAFIDMESQRLPAISISEVARRYQKLFKEAEDPEVRVDALHRLLNLQSIAGNAVQIDPDQERVLYRKALDSYEMIVSSGVYYGRLDELLYQMARAYAFVGDDERSVERLRQLVGLYPQSDFALEARFRIAEYDFSSGNYSDADTEYQQVMAQGQGTAFEDKAQYMLGWSRFKEGHIDAANQTFINVLDSYYKQSDGFTKLDQVEADTVEDSFRILSIIAAEHGGPKALNNLLAKVGTRPYAYLLYDRLADYYLANQRYADSVAADQAFIDRYPDHSKAPAIAAQIVLAYEAGQFDRQAREAKVAFVERYANDKGMSRLDDEAKQELYSYLKDLGRYHYRRAQNAENGAAQRSAYAEAADYLSRLGTLYPADPDVGPNLLLAADAYREAGKPGQALALYHQAAYSAPAFSKSNEAAYSAVLIRRQQWATGKSPEQLDALTQESRQFANVYHDDPRADAVRVHVANVLYDNGRTDEALAFAEPVVRSPSSATSVTDEERRSAWLVVANTAFSREQYQEAEQDYRQALKLADGSLQTQIRQQLATAIYKQGEKAGNAGFVDDAVAQYQRVASVAPDSPVTVNAQYDAASMLLKASRWPAAINALIRFRQQHPDNALTQQVPNKLVFAYESAGQYGNAAKELLAWNKSQGGSDPVQWQRRLKAADLYRKAGDDDKAFALYEDYLKQGPAPATAAAHEQLQDIRQALAERAGKAGHGDAARRWQSRLVAAEQDSPLATEHSRLMASNAAMDLAEHARQRFAERKITQPLKASLSAKRKLLRQAVDAYQTAAAFGDSEGATHATYALGQLYTQLASDLKNSERPKGLSDQQLEQYNLLLEEQTYPFENKAISFHKQNQARIPKGTYTPWVQKSLDALAKLYPARYARDEKLMGWVNAAP